MRFISLFTRSERAPRLDTFKRPGSRCIRRFAGCLLAVLASSCLADLPAAPEAPGAGYVLTNARAWTLVPDQPWADTVVVSDGQIATVYDAPLKPEHTNLPVHDLGGRMLLPAFQDTHAHLASGGTAYTGCPLFDLGELEPILEAIRACAAADPDAELLRGVGWTHADMPDGHSPKKEWLDAIDATRPLVFDDADGHTSWLNSKALATWGITAETPEPPGGHIARIEGGMEPAGTLHEPPAMDLVRNLWPPYTDEEIERGLEYGRDLFHSMGITAFTDAHVSLDTRDEYRALPGFETLAKAGTLKLHASLALGWKASGGEAWLEALKDARARYDGIGAPGQKMKVNMIKFWADGVVEIRTAFLLQPYSDAPHTHGLMTIPREELIEMVRAADAAGFQVHIHGIGDAAVRYSLDALEAALQANGQRDARHHINHVQFVHPDDVPRFAELGVGATFEPLWAYEDTYITDLTRPRVGSRIDRTYPIKSIMDTGARVAFSSDWSVSSANPLEGIEVAVTRVNPWTNEGEPFLPEQRITLEQAIAAYTREAAWINGFDNTTGTLEAGKLADLVILDRDLFEVPVQEISDVKVVATLFAGEVVYGELP